MDQERIEGRIRRAMDFQNALFNAHACPDRSLETQFFFDESEGSFPMRLSIRERRSSVLEGLAKDPICEIRTDLETWNDICGEYISPWRAIREKRTSFKGNVTLFKRLYSGTSDWDLPSYLFKGPFRIDVIKNVLLLNCAPRPAGATHITAERLAMGMRKAGASVEVLSPARMKINPCIGCFRCWKGELAPCVYHEKDEMRIILEKFRSYDLVVWATPIYHYFGSTVMKTVQDRLFVNADSHIIKVEGQFRHPRKMEHLPYYAVLAVGGFPDMSIFEPLKRFFRAISNHSGIRVIGEIYRHTSMPFTIEGLKMRKKDEALSAIEEAGRELVELKRIRRSTKRVAEQEIVNINRAMAAANWMNGRM
jgi:multimeric flavodoxin WrbA